MKKFTRLALPLILFALVTAAPRLHAEDAASEPPPRERGPGDAKERLQAMAEQLGLTTEQKEKVGAIMRTQREEAQAIREDESLSRRERIRKAKKIGQATREQIRALLTPEQQAKFDAMPQRGPGGPRGERPRRD